MTEINVGDRVQWQRRGHREGTMVTGVVICLENRKEGVLAIVKSDLGGQVSNWVSKLKIIEAQQ